MIRPNHHGPRFYSTRPCNKKTEFLGIPSSEKKYRQNSSLTSFLVGIPVCGMDYGHVKDGGSLLFATVVRATQRKLRDPQKRGFTRNS